MRCADGNGLELAAKEIEADEGMAARMHFDYMGTRGDAFDMLQVDWGHKRHLHY